MLLSQTVTKLSQQGVMRHPGEIVDLNLVRQALAAGSAHADERRLACPCPGGHGSLCGHLVTGIDDHVDRHALKNPWPVCRLDKFFDAHHITPGVNQMNAFTHCLNFGLPHGGGQRMGLAIDVGLGNMVKINEHKLPHSASSQRLCRPGTHATDAHDGNASLSDARRPCGAVEPRQTTKSALKIGSIHRPFTHAIRPSRQF